MRNRMTKTRLPKYRGSQLLYSRHSLFHSKKSFSTAPHQHDLYKILNINTNASHQEIKDAYHELAKKNHPDRGGSHEEFLKINRAYRVLLDDTLGDMNNNFNSHNQETRTNTSDSNFTYGNPRDKINETIDNLFRDVFWERTLAKSLIIVFIVTVLIELWAEEKLEKLNCTKEMEKEKTKKAASTLDMCLFFNMKDTREIRELIHRLEYCDSALSKEYLGKFNINKIKETYNEEATDESKSKSRLSKREKLQKSIEHEIQKRQILEEQLECCVLVNEDNNNTIKELKTRWESCDPVIKSEYQKIKEDEEKEAQYILSQHRGKGFCF